MTGEIAGKPEGATIVVMGVSGVGKSTVAAALAQRLKLPFADADGLHPPANVDKMASGLPLTDEDRWPWLRAVGELMADPIRAGGMVVACSALKRSYRDRLRTECPSAVFVHLVGAPELLASRISARQNHFMPPILLASQLATLEMLDGDERGFVVDAAAPVEDIVESAVTRLEATYV